MDSLTLVVVHVCVEGTVTGQWWFVASIRVIVTSPPAEDCGSGAGVGAARDEPARANRESVVR